MFYPLRARDSYGKMNHMRSYELVIVLRPTLKEEDRKKQLETIKSWLTDVKIVSESDMGSKALAYKIKKELTGHYFDFILEAEKGLPVGFEKKLLEVDDVLRHLVIRTK